MFHYQVSSCLSTGVGSRVHAEPLQSRSRVVRTEHILNAKTVQSGCIPLEWLQTRCKPNAKTVQSVPLCSDLPRALPRPSARLLAGSGNTDGDCSRPWLCGA